MVRNILRILFCGGNKKFSFGFLYIAKERNAQAKAQALYRTYQQADSSALNPAIRVDDANFDVLSGFVQFGQVRAYEPCAVGDIRGVHFFQIQNDSIKVVYFDVFKHSIEAPFEVFSLYIARGKNEIEFLLAVGSSVGWFVSIFIDSFYAHNKNGKDITRKISNVCVISK